MLWAAMALGLLVLAIETFFGLLFTYAAAVGDDPVVGLLLYCGLPLVPFVILLFVVGLVRGSGTLAQVAGMIGLVLALASCPFWYMVGMVVARVRWNLF